MTDTQAQEAARLAEWHRDQALQWRRAAAFEAADYPEPTRSMLTRKAVMHVDAADLIERQAARIAELERELRATSDKLQDLQSLFDRVKERRAQISHRLWVWAHEELGEPLKTRYFNIVANGTADVMEHPTYAQQYNGQKYRAEAAEAERDALRAELARMREPLSDEQIRALCKESWVFDTAQKWVRAIEAAHGITKTGEQK